VVTLTLRHPSPIPVELDGITPDRLSHLSLADIERLPILHGNRSIPLAELFRVDSESTSCTEPALCFRGTTTACKRIGAGMSAGEIVVEGDAGMHAGAGMSAGRIHIRGQASDWLGAEMTGGRIEVTGAAGHLVGAAYRGGLRGMNGGMIHIRGNAGDELGLRMRRGLIVVEGEVGEFAGAAMLAGTIIVRSRIGRCAGAGMKRGTLVSLDPQMAIVCGFAPSCEYEPVYARLLERWLRGNGIILPELLGRWRCYRGDQLTGGLGELLIPA
jgi:formylmethanofuran dehydrogenase subunit C